jgi:hypothetical protein
MAGSYVEHGMFTFGCPTAEGWERWWAKITLPLAGVDLREAQEALAAYTDPEAEQGEDGDCRHCVAQIERLAPLVEQGEALARERSE